MSRVGHQARQAVRLERHLLGTALEGAPAARQVLGALRPSDYIHPPHGRLHEQLALLVADGRHTGDLESIYGHLLRTGRLDAVGGLEYLSRLLDHRAPSPLAVSAYLREHEQLAGAIRIAEAADAIASLARGVSVSLRGQHYDPPDTAVDLVRLSTRLQGEALRRVSDRRSQWTTGESLEELQRVARLRAEEGKTRRKSIGTGIPILDDNVRGGWRPGQLVIIPGRPGMGKTAASLAFALAAALKGCRVGLFSMEMEHHELTMRLLALLTGGTVDEVELATTGADPEALPEWDERRWDDLLTAESVLRDLPIRIDDQPGQTVAAIEATCETWRAADGALDMVVIDYLQLMDHGRAERLDIAIGTTTRRLKQLAKNGEMPVVLLSQLNRSVEKRADARAPEWIDQIGRPRKSDLKDSGAIEQDADVIIAPMHARYGMLEYGQAAFLIIKQRGAPEGEVPVAWEGECMRYYDPEAGASPDDLL